MQDKIGKLYIVATPIGNMEDITIRSLNVLKDVDFILAEDTRTAIKLLNRYEIRKKIYSYYAPKEKYQSPKYISMILEGKNAALVSENGTPCVSDPGQEIIARSYENNIEVIPIPGPSALSCVLSICGYSINDVVFAGFLPKKKGQRKNKLKYYIELGLPFVFYESKYRLKDTLVFIKELSDSLDVFIGREMTKKYEEYIRGNILEVEADIASRDSIKGEFAIVCSACRT